MSFGWGRPRNRRRFADGGIVPPATPLLEIGGDDILLIGTKHHFSAEQIARFRHNWDETMRNPNKRAFVIDPDMFVIAKVLRTSSHAAAAYSARFGDCG